MLLKYHSDTLCQLILFMFDSESIMLVECGLSNKHQVIDMAVAILSNEGPQSEMSVPKFFSLRCIIYKKKIFILYTRILE